ncbi:MAG: hypothetical protein IJU58_01110 [Clostridia bacterium]|nr:hypothetical protein [Clostridia bacterium]
MSQTKQKTKIKTSTVAIIALSMILVLSLVATITLAYFTATRNVVTTVQFANGVSLQMWGAQFKTNNGLSPNPNPDTPPSNSAAELYWLAKSGTGGQMSNVDQNGGVSPASYGGYEEVNDVLEFQNLRIRTVDSDAFVAFKMIVTVTDRSGNPYTAHIWDTTTYGNNALVNKGFILPTPTSNWQVYSSTTQGTNGQRPKANPSDEPVSDPTYSGVSAGTDWYVYTGSYSSISKLSHGSVTYDNAATTENTESAFELIFGNYDANGANPGATETNTGYKIPQDPQYMNDYAGLTFTYRLIIVASDTQPGLNQMIADSTYADTSAYGVNPSNP